VDTALTLLLAEQNLKPLLPQQVLGSFASIVNQAHVTLDLQDRTGNRQIWADSVRIVPKGFVLQQPEITSGVMETVYNAMGKQRQLQITKDGKESVINPLGLVMRGPVIYLVCNYHGYDNIRITALHRIESATVQMTDLVIPKDFNLDETLQKGIMSWQLEPGQSQHFVIEVNAFIARYLDENRINATQEISLHTDGSAQVAFTAEDTLVLRQWLLGFGAEIEVKKPVAVRKWIGDVIKKMAGVYGE
jgi:predicted DNA-binding transcriptional regulator YafY